MYVSGGGGVMMLLLLLLWLLLLIADGKVDIHFFYSSRPINVHGRLKCYIYGDLVFGRATPGAWGEFISTEMLDLNIRQGNTSP